MSMSNRSESVANLAAALSIAQGQIKTAPRDQTADTGKFKYSYATLDSIWDACRKPLSDNGLSVIQLPYTTDNGFCLETILAHSSGEWMSSTISLPIEAGRMSALQAMGSAITYARRYALGAMVGVTVGEDDDGQSASISARDQNRGRPVMAENVPWQADSPAKGVFFKRACDTFGLNVQDVVDELKAAGFTNGYKPELAAEMWQALEKAASPAEQNPLTQGKDVQEELSQEFPEIFPDDVEDEVPF